ncbi:MAG TPA: efflux RND transporter permease subunit [Steroidobacteraceae bacterium]|nr:efflux RND transporter permease subunit [Steroidobacteraceae bacterium]
MRLLEFPIRRYQFTLVAFLCLVALGVYSFMGMPREEDPHLKLSVFFVTAISPGSDPKDLERLVAKPIEDRIAGLDDVHKLETTVVDGVVFIAVEFDASTDPDKKYDEITREINALRPELPADLARLEIRKIAPALVNIEQLALVSQDAPYAELEDRARELRDVLRAVPGIRTAETWAYPARELRVTLQLPRLAAWQLTPDQVLQALQSGNANVPAGFVDLGSRTFSVKSTGSYSSLDQVRDTVIAGSAGRIVRIRDVADVAWDNETLTYTGDYNGQRAVFVTANQKDGYNILAVQKSLDAALDRFETTLPQRIHLARGFEQARNVSARLNRLYTDFSIAIGLVLLTLLPLGWRAASVVMISIPLSLAVGIASIYFMGYSLNQISIAGFVVALGLLVDDSIVVVENIARHLREGASRIEAALAATRQIFVAVLGCTAALIFAFLPLIALPGSPGKFIRVLPVTIVATILGSLLIALFITPFMASRMLSAKTDSHASPLLDRIMGAIHRYYRPALQYCLARPRAAAGVAIGGSLLLIFVLTRLLGSSLFPKADTPQFLVTIEAPNGSSYAATQRALKFAEQQVAKVPQLAGYFSNLGHGNPQIYYNHIVHNDSPNYAEMFVQLKRYDTHQTPKDLEALRTALAAYPAAHIYVKEFVNGTPITAPIAVRVIGPELAGLDTLSRQVQQVIESTPGTRDVSNPLRVPRTNLKLQVDTEKAGLLGVPAISLERAVRLAVSGLPAGNYKADNGEQYGIVLRTPMGTRADLSALDQVQVPTVTGQLLPLSQLAHLEFERAPTVIERFARERSVTLDSEVQNGFNTGKVTAALVKRLDAMSWPRGYHYVLGGEAESSAESFGGIGVAIIVALFGIFAILVLEFGSFRATLIVLTVVPLGVMGGLLMLLFTGNDISFVASIGFVALIGIEIKNSILLVDFTNQLRLQGVGLDEAIERAGEIRFLPILLTSVTAIGGLLPLALQNIGLYSPMAWVIIGGLISSTLLARLVTPVIYKLLPPQIVSVTAT